MNVAKRIAAVALTVALLGVAGYQTLTRGYIYANIGTLFAWSSTAQTSWNGSSVVATCGDYTTYVKNDGTACPSTIAALLNSFATAHAVITATHSPLVANNTFAGGSMTSWSTSNTSGCAGLLFTGVNSTDQDGDTGYAQAGSGNCTSTAAVVTLTQSFSTTGAPASQSFSLWYKAPTTKAGATACLIQNGAAPFTVAINGTTVATVTPTYDNAWHQVSNTTTAMVNGSNTLTVTATLTAAQGNTTDTRTQGCTSILQTANQPLAIDAVVLTGSW